LVLFPRPPSPSLRFSRELYDIFFPVSSSLCDPPWRLLLPHHTFWAGCWELLPSSCATFALGEPSLPFFFFPFPPVTEFLFFPRFIGISFIFSSFGEMSFLHGSFQTLAATLLSAENATIFFFFFPFAFLNFKPRHGRGRFLLLSPSYRMLPFLFFFSFFGGLSIPRPQAKKNFHHPKIPPPPRKRDKHPLMGRVPPPGGRSPGW